MPLGLYPPLAGSPETYLDGGIDDEQTTITVLDASKLPDAPNIATIGLKSDFETIKYTEKSGNNLIGCVRGYEGTARAWNTGTIIANVPCAQHIYALQQKAIALEGDVAGAVSGVDTHINDTTPHEGYVAPKNLPITAERTDETYTLALTDNGSLIPMNRATAQTLIVPLDSTVDFPTGAQILIWQKGEGQVTITGESDGEEEVTLLLFEDEDTTIGQNAVAGLIKVAADTWLLFGRLEMVV